MAFQPVPDTALLEIRYLQDNQEVENGLYFKTAAEWTETLMAELSDTMIEWWTNEVQPWQVSTVQLKEVYVTPLESQTAETYSYTPTSPLFGAYVDEPEPNSVSLAIKFNTANRGRGSSGRNYSIGVADAFVDQNTFSLDYVNGIVGAYNALKPYIAPFTGMQWVHVRRTINKVKLAVGQTFPVQSATYTDRTVDSQRRRLPGRGQ